MSSALASVQGLDGIDGMFSSSDIADLDIMRFVWIFEGGGRWHNERAVFVIVVRACVVMK